MTSLRQGQHDVGLFRVGRYVHVEFELPLCRVDVARCFDGGGGVICQLVPFFPGGFDVKLEMGGGGRSGGIAVVCILI